jgi:hypothetical protein
MYEERTDHRANQQAHRSESRPRHEK